MKIKLIFLYLIVLLSVSCAKDEIKNDIVPPNDGNEGTSKNVLVTNSEMILGEKLDNPYSLRNMRKALNNLLPSTRAGVEETDIEPTHLYVKFKPKNDEELSVLKSDSTLILYAYPLDYDIEQYGEYHDPEVPEDQPTYQYASVTVDKVLPQGVDYEILEELFIPDEDKEDEEDDTEEIVTRSGKTMGSFFVDQLVDQALKITGNEEEEVIATRGRSKWRPAGRIMMQKDNGGGYFGFEGVKVRARRWFTTHTGITDANGYYSCDGRFKRPANYSFKWERYDFEIRNGAFKQPVADGPKQKGDWNVYLTKSLGKPYYYSIIFRAAYHYYYKNIQGLRRPPQNAVFKTQLKIRAHYKEDPDKNGQTAEWRRFLGLGSAVHIFNPSHTPMEIYATTIHELAHTSHWNMGRFDFNRTDDKVKESWATGVQLVLTKMTYPAYKGKTKIMPKYTNVVMDLIDDQSNDGNVNGKNSKEGDKVSGYTIRQIEDKLNGARSWNAWRDKLKQINNSTKNGIDALFKVWE